jgi:hypothetical protein
MFTCPIFLITQTSTLIFPRIKNPGLMILKSSSLPWQISSNHDLDNRNSWMLGEKILGYESVCHGPHQWIPEVDGGWSGSGVLFIYLST